MESSTATGTHLDIGRYRERLQELETQLVRTIGRDVDEARGTADDQSDPIDQSMVDELRDEYLDLAQTDTEVLRQVRAALARIENGTFGRCVVDDQPIEPKRLDAVPWAPYCAKHQDEAEQRAGLRTPRA